MNNLYGTVRPAIITDVDKYVDIYYNYKPSRSTTDDIYTDYTKISSPSSILSSVTLDDDSRLIDSEDTLSGAFNLSLPVSIFGKVGYYTIYIRPREYSLQITDIGALGAYPDIRGIVLSTANLDYGIFGNDDLVGWRIEYFDGTTLKKQAYTRIVTSNNYCEVMTQNLTGSSSSSKAYRYVDSSSLTFLTVTPTTSPSFKTSSLPFIGAPDQTISISNTFFDPVCLEVEICEHDIESLWTSLNGDTIRSLDSGLVTVYNDSKGDGTEREIHTQHEFSTIKDSYNHNDLYEVKQQRKDNIEFVDSSVLDED